MDKTLKEIIGELPYKNNFTNEDRLAVVIMACYDLGISAGKKNLANKKQCFQKLSEMFERAKIDILKG